MGCCSSKVIETIAKILQVIIILLIVLLVVSFFIDFKVKFIVWIVLLIIFYVLYIFFEFCSPICKFLCHKTDNTGLKSILGSMFKAGPVFSIHCECYHFETHTVTVRVNPPKKGSKGRSGGSKKSGKKSGGSSGRKVGGKTSHSKGGGHSNAPRYRKKKVTKKVVTHRETVYFPYSSCIDISGTFRLNCDREKAMGKVYVKLELSKNISFADESSKNDYQNFKTNFYNRNRNRDKEISMSERTELPGFESHHFICIRDTEPCGINIGLYIIFTIIPLVELYKSYINSYCIDQEFTIKKLVSSKGNLNSNSTYKSMAPSIDIPSEKYTFEENEYVYEYNQQEMDKINGVNNNNNNGQTYDATLNNNQNDYNYNGNQIPPNNYPQQQPSPNIYDNNMNNNMNYNMNMNNNMDMNNNMNYNMNMNNNVNNDININGNSSPFVNINVNNNMNMDSRNQLNVNENFEGNDDDESDEDDDDDNGEAGGYIGN